MIFKMLDNVRKKPESARRRVAFIATAIIMSGVVLLWIGTLPSRFSDTAEETENNISPFSVLVEQGRVFYDSATDGVSAVRDGLNAKNLPAAIIFSGGEMATSTSDTGVITPDPLGDLPFFYESTEKTDTSRATTTEFTEE